VVSGSSWRERRTKSGAVLLVAVGLAVFAMSERGYSGWFAGSPPVKTGAVDGRLHPCPDRPNCVCSQDAGARYVAPLTYTGDAELAMARLKQVVLGVDRVRIVEEQPGYMRVEAVSRLFGFVDDVEFLIDRERSVVHVRSASRLGYSDLGVNRRRIEAIRQQFESRASSS